VGVGHGAVKTAQLPTELATADVVLMVAVDTSEEMASTVIDGVGDGTNVDMDVEIASRLDEAEEEAAEEEAAKEELAKSTDDETVDGALVKSTVELTESGIEEAVEVVDDVEELGAEDGIIETLLVERIESLAIIDEIGPFANDGDNEDEDEDCAVEADPMTDGNVDELYWVDETTDNGIVSQRP
jgi:hypothetical protein